MAKKHKHVTITNWKGYKNYECNHCEFATLNRNKMEEHTYVHIRAGVAQAEADANAPAVDEDYGLDVTPESEEVGAQTKAELKKAAKAAAKEGK